MYYLTKGKSKIKFDIVMNVGESVLYGTILKPKADEITAAVLQKPKTNKPMSILEAHFKFGHTGEVDVRKTAKACGLGLKQGSLPRCESCAIAKAKQKSVPCISEGKKATKPNQRVYLDQMTMKPPASVKITIRNKNMRLIVDEYTSMSFADFNPKKNGFINKLCATLYKWKQEGREVKYVRMDNAPENFKFIQIANGQRWKLNLTGNRCGNTTKKLSSRKEICDSYRKDESNDK